VFILSRFGGGVRLQPLRGRSGLVALPSVVFGAALLPENNAGLWLEHLRCSGTRSATGSRELKSGESGGGSVKTKSEDPPCSFNDLSNRYCFAAGRSTNLRPRLNSYCPLSRVKIQSITDPETQQVPVKIKWNRWRLLALESLVFVPFLIGLRWIGLDLSNPPILGVLLLGGAFFLVISVLVTPFIFATEISAEQVSNSLLALRWTEIRKVRNQFWGVSLETRFMGPLLLLPKAWLIRNRSEVAEAIEKCAPKTSVFARLRHSFGIKLQEG
jgi:hypothetical protein